MNSEARVVQAVAGGRWVRIAPRSVELPKDERFAHGRDGDRLPRGEAGDCSCDTEDVGELLALRGFSTNG